jgi:hypothetical protein
LEGDLRSFTALLVVIVAMFAGYTYWEVSRLQVDVSNLKVAVAKRQAHGSVGTGSQDAARLLAQATENCKRARLALERGQTAKAKRELNASLQELAAVSKMSGSGGAGADLTAAWQGIRDQMDKLWTQFAKERKSGAGH